VPFLKSKNSKFIIFSVSLHLILMLLAFIYYKDKVNTDEGLSDVEFTFLEEPLVENSTEQNRQLKQSKTKKNENKDKREKGDKITLKKLMPSNTIGAEDIFEKSKAHKNKENEFVVEDLSFYREIWKAVDAKFYYPDVFNALFIKGGVSTTVYLKPDGRLSRYVLSIEGANEDVELFIKSIIVEALSKPLHSKYWLEKNEEVKLRLHFNLEMLLLPEALDHYNKGHVNRRELFFHRKLFNPKASAVAKALPFLAGPGMVDVVYIFNKLSGRQKMIYKRNLKKLSRFKIENKNTYNKKRN